MIVYTFNDLSHNHSISFLNLNPYLFFPVPIIKLKPLKCFNLNFIERIICISFNSFIIKIYFNKNKNLLYTENW